MSIATMNNSDTWRLWHQRLGHLSVKNMKNVRASDVEFNKDKLIKEFRERILLYTSALCKQTKQPHKSEEKDKSNSLVTVHSDLMGPMRTKSLVSKSQYIVTYLCNKTEYSFVYLMKDKSEQFEKFKEFKSFYENLTKTKVQVLRTDNGLEYLSNEFKKFLKANGIKQNTSVEYCPASNGKAERLNRTLVEKARWMLITSDLNINLWGAAVIAANYLRNLSPSSVLNGKSPYGAVFNKLPKINLLRIFGSEAYPLDLNKKGDKFEPVAKKNFIHIGYGDKEGIYWLLDKVFQSRDVKFN